jgi:hypothetical protein
MTKQPKISPNLTLKEASDYGAFAFQRMAHLSEESLGAELIKKTEAAIRDVRGWMQECYPGQGVRHEDAWQVLTSILHEREEKRRKEQENAELMAKRKAEEQLEREILAIVEDLPPDVFTAPEKAGLLVRAAEEYAKLTGASIGESIDSLQEEVDRVSTGATLDDLQEYRKALRANKKPSPGVARRAEYLIRSESKKRGTGSFAATLEMLISERSAVVKKEQELERRAQEKEKEQLDLLRGFLKQPGAADLVRVWYVWHCGDLKNSKFAELIASQLHESIRCLASVSGFQKLLTLRLQRTYEQLGASR